jgi:hypothetical protein
MNSSYLDDVMLMWKSLSVTHPPTKGGRGEMAKSKAMVKLHLFYSDVYNFCVKTFFVFFCTSSKEAEFWMLLKDKNSTIFQV